MSKTPTPTIRVVLPNRRPWLASVKAVSICFALAIPGIYFESWFLNLIALLLVLSILFGWANKELLKDQMTPQAAADLLKERYGVQAKG